MKKSCSVFESFKYAISGVIYALKTERNIKIHFIAAVLVLIVSRFFVLNSTETIILFLTISLVIISEMINTAIEKTVDLITQEYHPLAEIAKNVAAGAVLLSALNSIAVGYFIFYKKIKHLIKPKFIIAIVLIIMLLIILKNKIKIIKIK